MKVKLNSIIISLVILFFSSCNLFQPFHIENQSIYNENLFQNQGSIIVNYGDYIYKIGGYSDDSYTNIIYRAKIETSNNDLIIGEWVEDLILPINIAFGAGIAAGNHLYIIGGENENGTLDSIYYTTINEDGSLGFGDEYNRYWSKQNIKLPTPRSHMSVNYYDGRVFLIGGKNEEFEYSSIIHSRISMDHTIGHFYESPISLEKPLYNTSSLIDSNVLYIAGGISNEYISNNIYSFNIWDYGRITETSNIKSMSIRDINNAPMSLINPIFINDGNRLILGGGLDSKGFENTNWYHSNNGTWSLMAIKNSIKGPYFAHINNYILGLNQNNNIEKVDLDLEPKRPNIYPGSGLVRNNFNLIAEKNSFSDTLYNDNPNDNYDINSSNTKYTNPILITDDISYIFGNSDNLEISISEIVNYEIFNLGSILSIKNKLKTNSTDTINFNSLDLYLNETTWYQFKTYTDKEILFEIKDSSNSSTFTSQINYYLVEEDYYTMVLDIEGFPITNTLNNFTEQKIKLTPGTYYLRVDDIDESNGGTFGYLFKEL